MDERLLYFNSYLQESPMTFSDFRSHLFIPLNEGPIPPRQTQMDRLRNENDARRRNEIAHQRPFGTNPYSLTHNTEMDNNNRDFARNYANRTGYNPYRY